MVVTGAEAIDGDTVGPARQSDHQGHHRSRMTLKAKVTPVGDGAMRLTTQADINRQDFGVDGNMMGMIGDDATITADVVFRRAGG